MLSGRFALHLLVRFHDAVVEDRLVQRTSEPVVLSGDGGTLAVPPDEDGGLLGTVRWLDSQRIQLPDGQLLIPGQLVTLVQGDIEVDVRLVRQHALPRQILGGGDWFIVMAMAAMTIFALGFEYLLSGLQPEGGQYQVEPSAELIARLLDEDYEGEQRGMLAELGEEREAPQAIHSFYLPAGDVGPMDTPGGAEEVALETDLREQDHADKKHQPLAPEPPALAADRGSEAVPIPGVSEPKQMGEELLGATESRPDPEQKVAADREGWGFRDHDGAMDARDEMEIKTEIAMARAMLEIDPDDAWALQNLAYYQYLGEQLDDAQRTHERYVELYPDSAAGYNNLALVFKRKGEYQKEEGYYRLALAITPEDAHALNNLAVNLAHQQRYDEALQIMDRVAELEPGEPYGDLHRAKIHAQMGHPEEALAYLEKALSTRGSLDTLHSIEFRQDIRIDPAFDPLRQEPRFAEILSRFYGPEQAMTMTEGRSG
ncbi:MAG: tetratricopeptide repeat protein [Proteobacteria bacterium]|nr:tetratricopeptide repeat protein [Pseudomonadota bacterium]MCP4919231.1 tetratricopeptide repeat protein [Pseudomonadota bacterium]